ncbi:MAG: ParB/RepB/Spo0J family partition protein, partial [Chloroflexota bacterium]
MARPDFRSTAARRLAEERELSPAILSLISPDAGERPAGIRNIPLDRISPNPDQPRMNFDEAALAELASSVREHGVLQPILVRPTGEPQRYQLVAGERRWRAARIAELDVIPALIEQLDDETALEIGIIENLQR